MKIFRVFLLIFFNIFSTPFVFAQIEWIENYIDFGIIREDGLKRGAFKFVNKGNETVVINKVRATCGCTDVDYSKNQILKGDTAVINFSFNPSGRPGKTKKTIKLYLKDEQNPITLTFTGNVIGNEEFLTLNYPIEVNENIRLEKENIDLGELIKGINRHFFVSIYNQGSDTIQPEFLKNINGIDLNLVPNSIPPGETSTLGIYVNTNHIENYGQNNFEIQGKLQNETFKIMGEFILMPARKDLKDIDPKSGLIGIQNKTIEVKQINNDIVTLDFEIKNEGEKTLKIYGITNTSNALKIVRYPDSIKKGGNGNIQLKLNTSRLPDGPFRLKVGIISSDPIFPVEYIHVVGEK